MDPTEEYGNKRPCVELKLDLSKNFAILYLQIFKNKMASSYLILKNMLANSPKLS